MRKRVSRPGRNLPRPSTRLSGWLLEKFKDSQAGLAIFDRQFRFVGINDVVAAVDSVPVEEHVGRRISDIVRGVSEIIEPRIEYVFRTGKSLHRYEFSAKLPTRKDVGYWLEDFIPITNNRGRVREVGVIAVEITDQKRLEAVIRHLRHSARTGAKIDAQEALLALTKPAMRYTREVSPKLPARIRVPAPRVELPPSVLTPRELEVLRLLGLGQSNKQVASELMISEKTVETYRSRIMLKLGLSSLVDLTHFAIRHGIVEP